MYRHFFKRLFDLMLAIVGLPVFILIYIVFAPAIFLSDKGPIFYNAKRIGRNGKLFKMYKFRSMKVDAPDIRLEDGSTYNGEDDPRVTKVGKILRKTSLDESPQLFNVLFGDMSFVGPRPDPPDWLDRYPDDVRVFLTVRPGITGYSQAYFRNSADGEEKMRNDVFYALNYSCMMDLKIIFKTLAVILKTENMYKDAASEITVENSTVNDNQVKNEENVGADINS
ncbi:MAG: sugar transferase [bacterium]